MLLFQKKFLTGGGGGNGSLDLKSIRNVLEIVLKEDCRDVGDSLFGMEEKGNSSNAKLKKETQKALLS